MSSTTIIVIAVIVVIALLLLFLVRGRKQHVTLSDTAPLARAIVPPAPPAPQPASANAPEPHDVGTEIADAIEDVFDQFMGIASHPNDAPQGPGDTLTQLKGLGPKAANILNDLGVTRFEQIASWNAADIEAIDAQMGVFKGRIGRDRWVQQAKLLAVGDIETFEAEYGKLGG